MSDKSPVKESSSEEPNYTKDLPEEVKEVSNEEATKPNENAEAVDPEAPKEGANAQSYDFVSLPWKSCWDSNYHCYYYWNTETNETTYTFPSSENAKGSEAASQQAEGNNSAQSSINAQYPVTGSFYPQDPSQYYYPQQAGGAAVAGAPMNYYPSYAGLYEAPAPVQHSTEDPEYSEFIRKEYGVTTITSEGKIGGMFNAKTGNFQSDQTITPDKFSQYSKAVRQCNAFFDYDSFAEQRGLQYMAYYNGLTPNPRHQKLPKKVFEKLKTLKKEKKLESKKKWLRD